MLWVLSRSDNSALPMSNHNIIMFYGETSKISLLFDRESAFSAAMDFLLEIRALIFLLYLHKNIGNGDLKKKKFYVFMEK